MNKKNLRITSVLLVFLILLSMVLTSCVQNEKPKSDSKYTISTTVYITRTGSKYHVGSCGYLHSSKIPISLTSAKNRGYTPCSRCRPPR